MEKPTEVLIIGRVNVDYLSVLKRYPQEDTKIKISERITDIGGQGGNTACCIARLGGRLKLISRVGDDGEGRFCLELFKSCGIETGLVKKIKGGHTPVSYVFISASTGRRTIMYDPETLPEITLSGRTKPYISRAKVLLLDPSVTYLAKDLAAVKDRPAIVYDCETWRDGMKEMMDVADYFAPSSAFLTDKTLGLSSRDVIGGIKALAGLIAKRLVVTDAGNGAYYIEDGSIFRVIPPKVKILDTTGAGDNFHAGLALAVSRNFSIEDAVKFGVAVASVSCSGYGGRAAVPVWDTALAVSKGLKTERVCPL